jgi:predicted DsbA family dithiol-disulfide isomerase
MIVEIYADLICPWCYIGKHRLERALADRPRLPMERRWQPFELNPDMPPGGMDRATYLNAKFGGFERARQVYSVIEETAARDNIPLHLGRLRRTPNTLNAHRLVRFAQRFGAADTLTGLLFDAYFVEGLDIGERDVLLTTGVAAGLDRAEMAAFLSSDADIAGIRTTETLARQIGIQAVPCFIFNRRYALAGAQEPDAFIPLLDLAADESVPPVSGADPLSGPVAGTK